MHSPKVLGLVCVCVCVYRAGGGVGGSCQASLDAEPMCSAHGITQKHMAAFFFFSWILFQKIKGKAVPVSVQFSHSVVSDSLWPPGLQPARLPCPSPTPGACLDSWSWSRSVMESVMPSSHLILCRPLLFLTLIFPSIRVFSNESVLHIRCPKNWSFSFSISPSNEHPGLLSFRMDWLVLLAVQETLKSLLQHHSSKTSILQRSAIFRVQHSHPYMTTRKTIALTKWTFVDKVMS